MDNKVKIFLDPDGREDIGLCLVVEHNTGVEYSTQCAGYLTDVKSIEGFLIPLGSQNIENKIYEFFWNEFGGNCYEPHNEWTSKRINRLGELIAAIPCWFVQKVQEDQRLFLELDKERIKECVEAWIPVKSPYGHGILMLKNSD